MDKLPVKYFSNRNSRSTSGGQDETVFRLDSTVNNQIAAFLSMNLGTVMLEWHTNISPRRRLGKKLFCQRLCL
jgi:hypothetical protein